MAGKHVIWKDEATHLTIGQVVLCEKLNWLTIDSDDYVKKQP